MKILGNITRALASDNRVSVMEMAQQEFGIEVSERQAEAVLQLTRCRMGRHSPQWCRCEHLAEQNRIYLASLTPEQRADHEEKVWRAEARGVRQRVEPCDTDMRIVVKTILIDLGAFGNGGKRYNSVGNFAKVPLHCFPIYYVTDEERRRAWSYYDEWKEAVGLAIPGIERTDVLLTPIDRVARRVTRMIEERHPCSSDWKDEGE